MRAAATIITACALLSATATHAQAPQTQNFYGPHNSGIYNIADRHFRGILFQDAFDPLTSTRVFYPGLRIPEQAAAGAALLPNQVPPNTAGWNGLYAWTDIDLHPASAGVWIGDLNYGDGFIVAEYSDIIYSWHTHETSMRGALWVTPPNNERLRGFSVATYMYSAYAYNGNPHEGLTDVKHAYIHLNALAKLSENYLLRVGIDISNRHSEDPSATRFSNRRLFTDGISAGIVDNRLRTLEVRFENTFALNFADEKTDTVSLSLRFTQGWARSYMKHRLYAGIKADAGLHLPSNINEEAGSFQYMYYMQNLTTESRTARTSLTAPIILDAHLYRGTRCMLSIAPMIAYSHTNPRYPPQESPLYLEPQHRFLVYMPPAELSITGIAGDKAEFTLVPALTRDILISAVEVRYRF